MHLTDFVTEDSILTQIRGHSAEDLFHEVVEQLVAGGRLPEHLLEPALISLLKKNATHVTTVASGVALPHGKLPYSITSVAALVVVREPIDLGWGTPVSVIVVLLSARDQTQLHLEALASIARVIGDSDLLHRIRRVTDPAHVYQILLEAEQEFDQNDDLAVIEA